MRIVMQALLTRPLDEIDLPQLVVGLIHVLHDNRPMVAFAAVEALAILHSVAGKEVDVLALVEGLDRSGRFLNGQGGVCQHPMLISQNDIQSKHHNNRHTTIHE